MPLSVFAAFVVPYVEIRSFQVFGLTLHAFIVLVIIAALIGFLLAAYRARHRFGISRERVALFSMFLIAGGLLGARFCRLLYEPDLLRHALTNPSSVARAFTGISSFGGYFGGLAGALLFFRLRCKPGLERLQLLDVVGFALPFSWFLGRVGCALVHDHPGILSSGWLTVAYPDGPRYDLGLLEALFLLLLAAVFLILDRLPRPPGFYFALYFSVYGPFRFLLDQLHVDPPRYFGCSVDEFFAVLATVAGIVAWFFTYRSSRHTHQTSSEDSRGISCNSVFET